MQETTDKILFEVAGGGHGAAAYPSGEISEYALNWLNYQVLGDESSCELLLSEPSSASQYLTNIDCSSSVNGDINGDSFINIQDIILTVNLVLNLEYNNIADFNYDGIINILDVIQLVNIILSD